MRFILSLMIVFMICLSLLGNDESQVEMIRVKSSEFDSKVVVLGPLGRPLGKVQTVTAGVTKEAGKQRRLSIYSLQGRRLETPIVMPYRLYPGFKTNALDSGSICELRVYQHGRFVGVPAEAWKEAKPVSTLAKGYVFDTELIVFRIVRRLDEK